MFEHLEWRSDRMLCNGLVFRLQHYRSENWDLGGECFVFYKTKELVDQYARFFGSRHFHCDRLLELGLWEGGSLAFWHEALQPAKSIGLDLSTRGDSPYFRRYVAERGLADRTKTFWGVDQRDVTRLRELVKTELDGKLDLVFDDASHVFQPTLSSFQALLPLLRPGGLYVIEDWAWEHWPECFAPGYPLHREQGLTALVQRIVEAVGTSDHLIRSVTVHRGFAAIERGDGHFPESFALDQHIVRRPPSKTEDGVLGKIRSRLQGLVSRS
jgi:predicted O-methyltransferase YrrM